MKNHHNKHRHIFILGLCLILFVFLTIATLNLFLGKVIGLSDEQINTVSGTGEVVVALGAAILIIYQLEQEKDIEQEENDIEEAQFILQYNQSFIQDPNMTKVESILERYMNGVDRGNFLNDSNRQDFVNYLVYLECMATLILRNTIRLDRCDDLLAYRFFLAMNNPVLQEEEIFPYANYYLGCLKLYEKWKKYRKTNGLEIPMEKESPLDRWVEYEKCIRSNIDIHPARQIEFPDVAEILYDTDPYIYPAAFGNKKVARKAFPYLINDTGVFQKDNLFVATVNSETVGVLSSFYKASDECNEYINLAHRIKNIPLSFTDVCKDYFSKLPAYVNNSDDAVYISCICVKEKCRGMKIGEQLLKYALDKNMGKKVYLHVLSDNVGAISLYKKYGFTVLCEEDGYSISDKKPHCLYMMCDTVQQYHLSVKRKY